MNLITSYFLLLSTLLYVTCIIGRPLSVKTKHSQFRGGNDDVIPAEGTTSTTTRTNMKWKTHSKNSHSHHDNKNADPVNVQNEQITVKKGIEKLQEVYQCVPFDEVIEKADSDLTSEQCRYNTCHNGCCRNYNFLVCDETNGMSFLPCVCNENTSGTKEIFQVDEIGSIDIASYQF